MKRRLSFFLAFCLVAGLIGLQTCAFRPKTVITVRSQGDYIHPDMIAAFTKETGIQVDYGIFEPSGETDGSSAGNTTEDAVRLSCDVLLADSEYLAQLADLECLLRLDWDKLSQVNQIDPDYLENSLSGQYAVPCLWTTMGLLYNPSNTDIRVTGWSDLFDDQFAGQLLMPERSREAFAAAMAALGLEINSNRPEDVAAASAFLEEQEPLVLDYCSEDELSVWFQSGEAILAPCYAGQAMTLMAAMPELSFIVPSEGSWRMLFSYAIPVDSQRQEAAYRFIDFMCRSSSLAKNSAYCGYSTPSSAAWALLDSSWRANPLAYPDQGHVEDIPLLNSMSTQLRAACQVRWLFLQRSHRDDLPSNEA